MNLFLVSTVTHGRHTVLAEQENGSEMSFHSVSIRKKGISFSELPERDSVFRQVLDSLCTPKEKKSPETSIGNSVHTFSEADPRVAWKAV